MYVFIDLFLLLSCCGECYGYFPGNIMDGLREKQNPHPVRNFNSDFSVCSSTAGYNLMCQPGNLRI